MKLSVRSWHYRLLNYMWGESPSNLCKYFWALVGTIGTIWFTFPIKQLIKYILEHQIKLPSVADGYKQATEYILIFLGFMGYITLVIIQPFLILAVTGGVGALIGIVFCIGLLVVWIQELLPKKKKKMMKPKLKQPNLIMEFVKAKKSKVCPILEFE